MTYQSILALDLATNTGWATCPVGGEATSGQKTMPDTGRDIGRFLAVYERWLISMLRDYEIDFIAYEQPILPRVKNLHTLRKLYSLTGLTELIGRKASAEVIEVPISSWRKHFIGRGTGFKCRSLDPKQMAITACYERGWNPATHDEAEALGILDYVMAKLDLPRAWPDAGLFAKEVT